MTKESICYGCKGHATYKTIPYSADTAVGSVIDYVECETKPIKGIARCPCINCLVKSMCTSECLLYKTYAHLIHVSCYQQSY